MIPSSNLLPADAAAIARGADILRRGGLVAFPTETVYGLGADASNDAAVAAIFAAKDRPRFNPLIVHVRDCAHAETFAAFHPRACALAERFWPGPLTLVLPRRDSAPISLLASAGLDTIAVRAPAHRVARDLLAACDFALAAPSANPSGGVSATTAAHVAAEMGARVELILDGGPSPLGIESTVIGFENETPFLLRSGAIARARIEAVTGPLRAPAREGVQAPGQLARHYAPRTPLRLDARGVNPNEALLAFGANAPAGAHVARNLSPNGDLAEAAAHLFAMLRELDGAHCACIAVMPVPEQGLGEAINDRLRRAATPAEP
ncbi:MAG TPA: L-threonylcarbamoyladenylate synthase [Rhizomicrobium sp.]